MEGNEIHEGPTLARPVGMDGTGAVLPHVADERHAATVAHGAVVSARPEQLLAVPLQLHAAL